MEVSSFMFKVFAFLCAFVVCYFFAKIFVVIIFIIAAALMIAHSKNPAYLVGKLRRLFYV